MDFLDYVNESFDSIIPIYIICIIVAAAATFLRKPKEEKPKKLYIFKKKSEVTQWKRSFEGEWNSIERNGFFEVL
jgi:hypothetical protein